jgi:hypothetical protein
MSQDSFEIIDLISAVQTCARGKSVGMLVSTSQAVEELRVLSGDFITPDEELANAVSQVALTLGCSIVFDEQAGAEVLKIA